MHGTACARRATRSVPAAGARRISAGSTTGTLVITTARAGRAGRTTIKDGATTLDASRSTTRSGCRGCRARRSRRGIDRARPGLRHNDAANGSRRRCRGHVLRLNNRGRRRRGCHRRRRCGCSCRHGCRRRSRGAHRNHGRRGQARSNGGPWRGCHRGRPRDNRPCRRLSGDRRRSNDLRSLARLRNDAARRGSGRWRGSSSNRGGRNGCARSHWSRRNRLGDRRRGHDSSGRGSRCSGGGRWRGDRWTRRGWGGDDRARRRRSRRNNRRRYRGHSRARRRGRCLLTLLDRAQHISRLRYPREVNAGPCLRHSPACRCRTAPTTLQRRADTLRLVEFQRTRMRLLLGHTDSVEYIQNGFALYFQFPC